MTSGGTGGSRDGEDREREGALIRRCQAGDLSAFDELVTLHRNRVFAMLVPIVRNEQDALDIAQEGFVRAWRSIGSFEGGSAFFTWLFRIMRNLAIDFLRRRRRRSEEGWDEGRVLEDGGGSLGRESDRPDERAWQGEIGGRIERALGTLSVEHREVLVLREFEGLTYAEMADVVGCSPGTVMSRLFHARRRMQEQLKDLYEKL